MNTEAQSSSADVRVTESDGPAIEAFIGRWKNSGTFERAAAFKQPDGAMAEMAKQTRNPKPGTPPAWPKTLPEQVRALRQVLETQTGPVDPAALAKSFKGVRKERIEILLETLQALGHAHELEDGSYSA